MRCDFGFVLFMLDLIWVDSPIGFLTWSWVYFDCGYFEVCFCHFVFVIVGCCCCYYFVVLSLRLVCGLLVCVSVLAWSFRVFFAFVAGWVLCLMCWTYFDVSGVLMLIAVVYAALMVCCY